jgi:hypothetical protein
MSEAIKTFFIYAQITVSFFVFFSHKRDSAFTRTAIFHAIGFTILLSLIQYGSAYSLDWDYSRWQLTNEFQIFPLRGHGGAPNSNTIDKTSFVFWFLTLITSFLHIAFPQAVLIAENKYFGDTRQSFRQALRRLKKVYRIGVGFFSTAIVISSLFSPFPCGNKIVMLIAYGVLILWLRSKMWEDLLDAKKGYFPG